MKEYFYYIFLVVSVVSNSLAVFFMKLGSAKLKLGEGQKFLDLALSMATNTRLIIGIIFFGISFVFSVLMYSKLNVNVVYPIYVGMTFFLISLFSIFYLSEKFTLLQVIGYFVIIIGIVLISINLKQIK